MEDMITLFQKIGLDERKAKDTARNKSLSKNLEEIIKLGEADNGCDKTYGVLLYTLATKLPKNCQKHRDYILNYIKSKGINSMAQLDAAIVYAIKIGEGEMDKAVFEENCGVGVIVTDEQIKACVDTVIESVKPELLEKRYRYPVGKLLKEVNTALKWVDGKKVKATVDEAVFALLGDKTEADNAKPAKVKKEEKPKAKKKTTETSTTVLEPQREDLVKLPDPRDNTQNRPDLLKKHLEETGGKIVCRFPPEPNGHLHIGHAKAMNLDFSYPKKHGGVTILRFDDTNPAAEKMEYIDSIKEAVAFMGHAPWKITYASDYFDQMHEMALKLIREGKAYVCHQKPEEISKGRETRTDSPWRDRPIEESMHEFERMRKGEYREGEAVLRLKMDMKNDNPCMQDLIAYRIKFMPHPKTGDKWCIYPSYDFCHCVVDSLENITHSLCTKEFEIRRASYFWLLDAIGLYKPVVWEFSRLNVSHTVVSKRYLRALLDENIVNGWDDPRMPTLIAMKRKGYSAAAMTAFCDLVGVTRSENLIPYTLLDHCVRKELDVRAPRRFAVLRPLQLTVTNWDSVFDNAVVAVEAPNHPKNDAMGTRTVAFAKKLFIDRSDFRMADTKDYFGLAPGKAVGLKYANCVFTCEEVKTDSAGNPVEVLGTVDANPAKKPKGFIHWLSETSDSKPLAAEVRLYEPLFTVKDPMEFKDWKTVLNPNSVTVMEQALVEPSLAKTATGDVFQFERVGFFCVDPDTTADKLVFNRTVTLKESKGLKEMKN